MLDLERMENVVEMSQWKMLGNGHLNYILWRV